MTRLLLALAFAVAISGCVTPAGQIPKEDFTWETVELPIGYQTAFRNLRQAFATCEGHVAEGDLYSDLGEGRLIVYLPATWPVAGRSHFVAGTITVARKDETRSSLTLAVQHLFDKPIFGSPGQIRATWKKWAAGSTECP